MKKTRSVLFFFLGVASYFLFTTLRETGLPAMGDILQGFLGSKIFSLLMIIAAVLASVIFLLKKLLER